MAIGRKRRRCISEAQECPITQSTGTKQDGKDIWTDTERMKVGITQCQQGVYQLTYHGVRLHPKRRTYQHSRESSTSVKPGRRLQFIRRCFDIEL